MWHMEKEPNGEYAIVIDGWEKGIASDPYSGHNQLLGVDLETPGEVSVGYPITANAVSASGGVVLTSPIADSTRTFTYTSPGTSSAAPLSWAILDTTGYVWESNGVTISGTWTALQNNSTVTGALSTDGLVYWMGYLWKFRNASIDYWNGTIWVNGWDPTTGIPTGTPITAAAIHYAYVGVDNVLYFTNGNFLGSLEAVIDTTTPANIYNTFNPTNTATYTFTATKLQLPLGDVAVSLAEVGSGSSTSILLVGGSFNAIYPWDKVATQFGTPIYLADTYAFKMVSANQNAYIFTGKNNGRGRIYITNGAQAEEYFKIPDYVFGVQDPYFRWGDAIYHRNNLVFSFFTDLNSHASYVQNFNYVWAIDNTTKAFRAISALASSSTFVANATVLIGTQEISASGFGLIVGWSNNSTTPGIGYTGTTAGINSEGTSILTDKIPVGTILQKKTFTQVEYKLRTALASGESISMYSYADNTVGSNLSFSPTVAAGVLSGVAPVNFQMNQWLQFGVSLIGNSNSSGVRLHEIRIR